MHVLYDDDAMIL